MLYLIVPIALGDWCHGTSLKKGLPFSSLLIIEHPSFCCEQDDTVDGETKFQNVEIVSCNRLQGDSWNQLGERISII